MRNFKIAPEEGDEITVDFVKNQNGGRPVCRVNNMVGFIERSSKEFVAPGSSWIVRVATVHPKYVTVDLLVEVRTPKDNAILMESQLMVIKLTQHKPKFVKPKRNYQYLSAQEKREAQK
jgi:hypothetical protein